MRALSALCGLTTLVLAATPVRSSVIRPQPGQAAVPDAEGYGAATPGGRGGREIAVTTLADAGPGSFRAAVTASGPRLVVFRLEGLVTLDAPVTIAEPFLTLDGTTA